MKNLYDILNVEKSASNKEITKAYRKLAVINHPDKGGSEDKFKEISEAYSILSDPNKKKIYDLGGYESVSSGFTSSAPFEMFNQFFEGGSFSANIFETGIFKEYNNNNKTVNLDVSIFDLYSGCKKSIDITTKNKCINCNGMGCKPNGKEICKKCNGSKFVSATKSFGPFIQSTKIPCNDCNNTGYSIKSGYECKYCDKQGIVTCTNKYNLNISKGSTQKEIVVKNKGDYVKELDQNNDLIIKINELPNDRFIHKNRNIYIEEDIHLWDSILGCDHIVKYIDSDIILNIDKIIDPNIAMIVGGYGMPEFGENKCGNLIIKFNIIYPDSVPNIEEFKRLVDHPNYDHKGIHIDYYNRIETSNQDDDNDFSQPQCVQQ